MKRLAIFGVVAGLLLGGLTMPGTASAQGAPDLYGGGLKLSVDDEDNMYIRFLTWLQVWGRVMETNPGTLVDSSPSDWQTDVMLRRARFMTYAQLTDYVLILMHFGINNQTFTSGGPAGDAFQPGLFFHDFYVEFKTWETYIFLGGGLIYGLGNSRMSHASTLNFLALDSPIYHWGTIGLSDQAARQLGFYARGDIEGLHYKLNVTRPFIRDIAAFTTAADAGPTADYNAEANNWALSAYTSYDFLSVESHVLPFRVGTYLGTKDVFNIGAGFYFHPDSMVTTGQEHDTFLLSVDTFLDLPIGDGAFTTYLSYSYYDLGPDNLRRIGVGSIGTNTNSHAYPAIGTGSHIYGQLGYLLPVRPFGQHKLMPYATLQTSFFDALDDPAVIFEVGGKYYLIGHHASITLHWRNRPVFGIEGMDATGAPTFVPLTTAQSRANEFILQLEVWL